MINWPVVCKILKAWKVVPSPDPVLNKILNNFMTDQSGVLFGPPYLGSFLH